MRTKSKTQTRRELREAKEGPRKPKAPLTSAQSYWAFVCENGGKPPKARKGK